MKATSFLLKVAVFATLWLLMKLVDRL